MGTRSARRHVGSKRPDQRGPFERDRDRILYTSAFRRLAGITQVVHAAEGQVFHNRLTHTLEVAQIALRTAQHLQRAQSGHVLTEELDADVVEAAALAHDLGHPPFGHIGEEELDSAMRDHVADGFEGNAQSFRIVTKLSARRGDGRGLNLTAATLDATLKYPWMRHLPAEPHSKFGSYLAEQEDFDFARDLHTPGDLRKSVEAEVMDWADDIGYAVHDLEDFYRAGLIPFDRLLSQGAELDRFLDRVFVNWQGAGNEEEAHRDAFVDLLGVVTRAPLREPYEGRLDQREALRSLTSLLIDRYITGSAMTVDERVGRLPIRLADDPDTAPSRVVIVPRAKQELSMLKRLVWEYVIYNPRLASQQVGQRKIVRTLYEAFFDSAQNKGELLTYGSQEELRKAQDGDGQDRTAACARAAADAVCRMTESEALRLFHRLTGHAPGSVLDAIIL